MVLKISSRVLRRIVEEAEAARGREVCGLLLGHPERITDALPCNNVAADPRTAFEIDPAQLIAAHRAVRAGGPEIVGCYHSHPSGAPAPSARDAADAAPDGSLWIIVAGRETGLYRAVEGGCYHRRFVAVAYHDDGDGTVALDREVDSKAEVPHCLWRTA